MNYKRAYRYRFYPTKEQAAILACTFGCVRFVYNWALNLCNETYKAQRRHLYFTDTSAALTTYKQQPDRLWLNEVSCVPLQQVLRHLDKAFKNFFERRSDFPVFKKKHGPQSAEYTKSAFNWDGISIKIAKMNEPLDIHWSRPLPEECTPSTVTVSKDTAGRYFISILVEEEIRPLPVTPQTIGLDLGITSLVALSTDEKVGNPQFFREDERKLARAERRKAKKKKGSKNREKAQWYSRVLVKIDRWEPTSKKCSVCGHVLDELDLSIRAWTCPECSVFHDRDINAAKNVHAAGLAVYACAETVRHGRAQSRTRTLRRSRKAS